MSVHTAQIVAMSPAMACSPPNTYMVILLRYR